MAFHKCNSFPWVCIALDFLFEKNLVTELIQIISQRWLYGGNPDFERLNSSKSPVALSFSLSSKQINRKGYEKPNRLPQLVRTC